MATKFVSAGIFSAETASEIAPRKRNQNAMEPTSLDGLALGESLSTYWPVCPECRALSEAYLLEDLGENALDDAGHDVADDAG